MHFLHFNLSQSRKGHPASGRDTGGLEPASLRTLDNDYNVLGNYSLIPNVLLLSTFLMLVLLGQYTIFLHTLLCVVVLTSFGIIGITRTHKMTVENLDYLNLEFHRGPDACGNFKPWVWCFMEKDYGVPEWTQVILISAKVFSLVATAVGIAGFLMRYTLIKFGREVKKYTNTIHTYQRAERALYPIFCMIQLIPLAPVVVVLNRFRLASFYTQTWNFGQIVAVLIWVAPFTELINVELRGMKKGLQSRVIRPYIVIKRIKSAFNEREASTSGTEQGTPQGGSEQAASGRSSRDSIISEHAESQSTS